ncbi:MAG: response regulator transcription factor [Bacteroidota bacterium]
MKILVIDQNREDVEKIERALKGANYIVDIEHTAHGGLNRATDYSYDAILTDVNFSKPLSQGIVTALKSAGDDVPIIVLSTLRSDLDEAGFFRDGAADFLRKPFHDDVLVQRISTTMNRMMSADAASSENANTLSWGELTINPEQMSCTLAGQRIGPLTVTEHRLIQTFLRHPGLVFNRDRLMDKIYGSDIYVDDRTIDSHIKRLRRKLRNADPQNEHRLHDIIQTLHGSGYKVDAFNQTPARKPNPNAADYDPDWESKGLGSELEKEIAELRAQMASMHEALGIDENTSLQDVLEALTKKAAETVDQKPSAINGFNAAHDNITGQEHSQPDAELNGASTPKFHDGIRMPVGMVFNIGTLLEVNTRDCVIENLDSGESTEFEPVVGTILEIMTYFQGKALDQTGFKNALFEADSPANGIKLGKFISQTQGVLTQMVGREYAAMLVQVISGKGYGMASTDRLLGNGSGSAALPGPNVG